MQALQKSVQKYDDYLTTHPDSLSDVAYSLNIRREVHSIRAFCVTNGLDAFELSRVSKPTTGPLSLVFCFTGQGAQWARMGHMLFEKEPIFKETFDVLSDALSHLSNAPPWNLKGNGPAPVSLQ